MEFGVSELLRSRKANNLNLQHRGMENKVATLRGLFPQTDVATLRRALEAHDGDMDRAVETLLAADLGQLPPSSKPDAKPTAPSGWTCDRCTFENRVGSRRCAMCDAANPALPQPITSAAVPCSLAS